MKVKELIEFLSEFNEDDDVMFSYNYGDHWRTEIAVEIGKVEKEKISWSEYHNTWKIIDMDEDDHLEEKKVIILSH